MFIMEEPPRQDAAAAFPSGKYDIAPTASPEEKKDSEAIAIENGPQPTSSLPPAMRKWKISRTGGGDTAMALFESPSDVDVPQDPDEIRRLVRKIDLMILPCIAVCYAFFYIDKTTL